MSGYIRQVARLFELDGPGLASRFFSPGEGRAPNGEGIQPALPFHAGADNAQALSTSPVTAVQHLAHLMEADALPVRDARLEAEAILHRARSEAQDLVRGAESYAHDVLSQLEEDLVNTLSIIRNGRRYLHTRRYEGVDEQGLA